MGDFSFICMFRVLVVDDVANQDKVEHGFCFANDFTSAVQYLEHHLYGDNLLEIQHMELFDACPIVSFEVWEKIKACLEEA